MPGEITLTLESMTVLVGGAVLVGFTIDGKEWRFFIVDAEAMEE